MTTPRRMKQSTVMRGWAVKLVRAIAITNALFVVGGLYLLADSLLRHHQFGQWAAHAPYYNPSFYLQTLVNLVFLVGLAVGSISLWRLSPAGRRICNVVFGGEIVYFLGSAIFSLAAMLHGGTLGLIGQAIGVTGDMGINLQLITAYPVIALIVMNFAFRKIQPARSRN